VRVPVVLGRAAVFCPQCAGGGRLILRPFLSVGIGKPGVLWCSSGKTMMRFPLISKAKKKKECFVYFFLDRGISHCSGAWFNDH
jgi:hypothetical protein